MLRSMSFDGGVHVTEQGCRYYLMKSKSDLANWLAQPACRGCEHTTSKSMCWGFLVGTTVVLDATMLAVHLDFPQHLFNTER